MSIVMGWTGWIKMLSVRRRHPRLWQQHPRLNDLLVILWVIIALWIGVTLIYLSESIYDLDVSRYRAWIDLGWSIMALLFASLMMMKELCRALLKQHRLQRQLKRQEHQ